MTTLKMKSKAERLLKHQTPTNTPTTSILK